METDATTPFVLSLSKHVPQAERAKHALRQARCERVWQFTQRGFTLIEIMVALVVFSLAALALIRLEGQTIRSTGFVTSTLLAQIVARNVAIEAVTDAQPPARGRASGVEQAGGRSWTWVRDTQPLGDGDVQRIDVAVSDAGGAVMGRATMVRPPPAPVSQVRAGP